MQFKCKKSKLSKLQLSSSWPIYRILSGATTLGQSGPGSDGNEGVLCIPQSSSNTGTSPSDWLLLCLGHLLGESYPSAEIQSVYSTAPTDWVIENWSLTIKCSLVSCLGHNYFYEKYHLSESYIKLKYSFLYFFLFYLFYCVYIIKYQV